MKKSFISSELLGTGKRATSFIFNASTKGGDINVQQEIEAMSSGPLTPVPKSRQHRDFELFIQFQELVQYPTLAKELLDRLLFSATVWAALNSVEDYTTQTYSEYDFDFDTTQLVVRIIW